MQACGPAAYVAGLVGKEDRRAGRGAPPGRGIDSIVNLVVGPWMRIRLVVDSRRHIDVLAPMCWHVTSGVNIASGVVSGIVVFVYRARNCIVDCHQR